MDPNESLTLVPVHSLKTPVTVARNIQGEWMKMKGRHISKLRVELKRSVGLLKVFYFCEVSNTKGKKSFWGVCK